MHFLLQIPAVKALVHLAVTPDEPNELIRLALTTGNKEAAAILLNIPAVRTLAEQHDFYRRESSGELDLRALARSRESSMRALTTSEQQRLESLTTIYQPMIEQAGVEQLINALREQLKERYETHSAMIDIEDDGSKQKIYLPFTWEAFQQLNLSFESHQRALKTYYQNKNHSAWRYLLKPNPWMHPNASYGLYR